MARKKVRKFAQAGEIVVEGRKMAEKAPEFSAFDSFDLGRMAGRMPQMDGGGGGGSAPVAPRSNFSIGKVNTPAGSVYGPRYGNDRFNIGAGLGRGALGKAGAPVAGISGSLRFKDGGKADGEPTGGKKRTKAKKYAAGGSTASKRADGCATKGKTKGRFV